MLAILMTFVMVAFGSGYIGLKLLAVLFRPPLEPALPAARVANTGGAELAYQHTTNLAAHGSRKLARWLGIALGLALLAWPLVVAIWYLATPSRAGIGSL